MRVMGLTLIVLLLLVAFVSPAAAIYKDFENVTGSCAGMKLEYKTDSQWSDYDIVTFRVTNTSGATAYNVTLTVDVYDYFGKFVGNLYIRGRGPMLNKWKLTAKRKTIKMPKMAAKLDCFLK
jgi:hypothetical protein